jgi:polyferredoxin
LNNPFATVRRVFALLLISGMALLFLIPLKEPGAFFQLVTAFQFTPSLVKFIFVSTSIAAAGFFFILILTFMTGRTYCSFLCPLGILQDLFIRAGFRAVRRKFRFLRPVLWLKTLVTVLFFTALILNMMSVISVLDPFSIYSRTMTVIALPAFSAVMHASALPLQNAGFYGLVYPVTPFISNLSLAMALVLFALLIIMSMVGGRIYCNTLCPVGGLLSLISHFSLFKIRIDTEKCSSCGLCADVCKAGCIDPDRKKILSSECIMCFNCLEKCSKSAMKYSLRPSARGPSADAAGRRQFLVSAGFVAGLSIVGTMVTKVRALGVNNDISSDTNPGRIPDSRPPVIPPGAEKVDHYLRSCIACQTCVDICPTRVLVPSSLLPFGIFHTLTPVLDYTRAYCSYECNKCSQVCPTSAIRHLTHTEKKKVSMGNVRLYKPDCIVYKNKTNCGACAEICPTGAVFMVPVSGRLNGPVTDQKICTGCGACEFVCPVSPKAIYVMGFQVHGRVADKKTAAPQKKKTENVPQNGFPF